LTTSNKIYDYLMAGMGVVSSDLPGLRAVIVRSGGGLLFQPGSPDDLARQIRRLYNNPSLLKRLSASSRAFALREGNREAVMSRFAYAFRAATVQSQQCWAS
jgi:glycosyltransferase involved in cell wall biosynthesis